MAQIKLINIMVLKKALQIIIEGGNFDAPC